MILRLATLALVVAAPVAAQVGIDPARSPFREQPYPFAVTPTVGYFGGSGGKYEVGPHDGIMYGARFQFRANKSTSFGAGVSYGTLTRRWLDPFVSLDERDKGDVDQGVLIAEAMLQLNLTGGKTWRRMSPFLGFSAGAAFADQTPAADTSGYDFGVRFNFAPFIGLRLAPTSRLSIRLEARSNVWKIPYPDSFREEPPAEPGTPEFPNAIVKDGSTGEWSLSGWYIVGVSFFF